MAYRVLVITPDDKTAEIAASCAGRFAASQERAPTGAAGLELALRQPFDLALLDLELSDMGGLEWLRIARRTHQAERLPVIALSARKSEDALASAFERGADDFIDLPCEPAELAARIGAVLRRRFERDVDSTGVLRVGPVELDPERHDCRVRGKAVALRPREFALLETLMRRAGRVLSRDFLLRTVWGVGPSEDTRSVDVAVSRLRKALGRRAGNRVETVERFGYRFKLPEAA